MKVLPLIDSIWTRENRLIINMLIDMVNQIKGDFYKLSVKDGMSASDYEELIITLNALIKKGEVTVDDINLNMGKIGLEHLSDEVIQSIAGTADVNAIVGDGSITNEKLADKSVYPKNTNFIKKDPYSKNLFDGLLLDVLRRFYLHA